MRAAGAEPEIDIAKLPEAPPNMSLYSAMIGKTFVYRVTGVFNGRPVYGTDLYTVDSNVALATVHAGIVKPGETGVVRVTIVGQQPNFAGSTRNGVTTSPHNAAMDAYKLSKY